jgi:hypothetical protein
VKTALAQPAVLATAPNRDLHRAAVAATAIASRADHSTAAVKGDSHANLGDDVSVVAQETHFQPTFPARNARLPLATPAEEAPKPHAEYGSAAHANRASPEASKSIAASRFEAQPKDATPAASPLQQVAVAITQEFEDASPERVDKAPGVSPFILQTEGREPLRLLKVALDPPELGRVNVRLRLTGRALEVTVTAERPETASLLDRDRHVLTKILHASGYNAEDITVQTQSAMLQATAPTLRMADAQTGNQATPHFQSGAGTDGGRQSPPRPQGGGREQSLQEMQVDETDSDPRHGDDLYV